MTDPVRDAAQELLDAITVGPLGVTFIPPAPIDALRRALASPTPSMSTAALRTHRCINDGGDGYECPGCHANGFLSPTPAPSTSRDDARDAALEEAAEVISHILDTNAHGSGRAALAVARTRIRSLKVQPPPHSTSNPEES